MVLNMWSLMGFMADWSRETRCKINEKINQPFYSCVCPQAVCHLHLVFLINSLMVKTNPFKYTHEYIWLGALVLYCLGGLSSYQCCIWINFTSCQSPDNHRKKIPSSWYAAYSSTSSQPWGKKIQVKAHFHKWVCRAEGKHEASKIQSVLTNEVWIWSLKFKYIF